MEGEFQKEGLVGIFDVLGYQNIVDNNQINYVADLISNTLLTLPQKTVDNFLALFNNPTPDLLTSVFKENINWKIFSDTILLSFPFPYKANPMATSIIYPSFFLFVSYLLRSAFDAGLPLRGAIDYGEFYIKENCFAGKPIINSYRLSQELQISGCAMTKSFEKQFYAHMKSDKMFKKVKFLFTLPYLVPLKKNDTKRRSTKRLCIIDWLCPVSVWKIPPDLRQYVAEKFSAHNKIIPRESLPKLKNTEMTLRKFLSKREKARMLKKEN